MFSERCHVSSAFKIVVLFGPPQKLESPLNVCMIVMVMTSCITLVGGYTMLLARWFFSEAHEVDVKVVLVLVPIMDLLISRQNSQWSISHFAPFMIEDYQTRTISRGHLSTWSLIQTTDNQTYISMLTCVLF